jgi:hypothetical protein
MQTIQHKERNFGSVKVKKYASLLTGLVISGAIALSPLAMAQRRTDQCSASVQSGSMPGFHTKGRTDHVVNTPLIRRESSYLSLTLPGAYVSRLTKAARDRPEAERRTFVRDVVHRNLDIALTSLGTEQRITFDCAPLTETIQSAPSASSDAGVTSADAGVRQPPPEQPRPVSSVPADAGVAVPDDAGRRRTIQPGQ